MKNKQPIREVNLVDTYAEEGLVLTHCTMPCDMCPYVIYGDYGERLCEKEMFKDCEHIRSGYRGYRALEA